MCRKLGSGVCCAAGATHLPNLSRPRVPRMRGIIRKREPAASHDVSTESPTSLFEAVVIQIVLVGLRDQRGISHRQVGPPGLGASDHRKGREAADRCCQQNPHGRILGSVQPKVKRALGGEPNDRALQRNPARGERTCF